MSTRSCSRGGGPWWCSQGLCHISVEAEEELYKPNLVQTSFFFFFFVFFPLLLPKSLTCILSVHSADSPESCRNRLMLLLALYEQLKPRHLLGCGHEEACTWWSKWYIDLPCQIVQGVYPLWIWRLQLDLSEFTIFWKVCQGHAPDIAHKLHLCKFWSSLTLSFNIDDRIVAFIW